MTLTETNAPFANRTYTVRDGIATGSDYSVLTVPLGNSAIKLAVAATPLPRDVRKFLHSKDWRRQCYEIFKPFVSSHTVGSHGYDPDRDPKNGFFARYMSGEASAASVNPREQTALHSGGTTSILLNAETRGTYFADQRIAEQPIIKMIEGHSRNISQAFGSVPVDALIRFERGLVGAVPGYWHTDGGLPHINCLVRGARMEYIPEPYVRPEVLEQMKGGGVFPIQPARKGRLASVARAVLGHRWDETHRVVTQLCQVKKMPLGYLANIVSDNSNNDVLVSGCVHRRRDSLTDRVLTVYFPRLTSS